MVQTDCLYIHKLDPASTAVLTYYEEGVHLATRVTSPQSGIDCDQ